MSVLLKDLDLFIAAAKDCFQLNCCGGVLNPRQNTAVKNCGKLAFSWDTPEKGEFLKCVGDVVCWLWFFSPNIDNELRERDIFAR